MTPQDIPPVGTKVTLVVDSHFPEIGTVDRMGTIADKTQYGYVHIRYWHHRYKDTIALADIISCKVKFILRGGVIVKFYSLIAQEGEDGQIFCTCHLAAKDEQGLAEHRAACGGNVDDCQTEDLKIIKSEDGRTWRLLLVEDLTEVKS